MCWRCESELPVLLQTVVLLTEVEAQRARVATAPFQRSPARSTSKAQRLQENVAFDISSPLERAYFQLNIVLQIHDRMRVDNTPHTNMYAEQL